jgi:hypothetical protein
MKKLYALTIGIALTGSMASAQYKITSYNAFEAGYKHEFIYTTNASEGSAGKNVTWDFSELQKTDKTLTTNMYTYTMWDKTGIIPQANVAIEEAGNWFFFKITNNGMDMYGSSNACGAITKYDKPLAKLKFPFSYGDKIVGDYSGVIINSDMKETPISGAYNIEADAYGTLLLPGNITINNALRVKQTRTFANADQKEITFRWYASGVRYPIVVMIKYESALQSSVSLTALYANVSNETPAPTLPVASEDKKIKISNIELMPNPFHEALTVRYFVQYTGNVTIDLIDSNGKLVKHCVTQTYETGNYENTILMDPDKAGTYFIRFTAGNDVITKKVVQN